MTNLPLLSVEQVAAIVTEAHGLGKWVAAHVTQTRYLRQIFDAGVDDAAHMVYDPIPGELIQRMAADRFIIVPTLTVLEAYGTLANASSNLQRFTAAGGLVSLRNDYSDVPRNGFDHFELGMPMHEIGRMKDAGMTNGDIILSATRNGARVCGLEAELGTVEAGKIADILVVNGNPLSDLSALTDVQLVIHDGVILRAPAQ